MINLTKVDDVKALQSNMRYVFQTSAGAEVMNFLEGLCGWFDFKESDPDKILIAHGGRRVLATIKTLLDLSPEQIVALAKENE